MARRLFFFGVYILWAMNCLAQIEYDAHKPRTATQANLKGAVHMLSIHIQTLQFIEGRPRLGERRPLVEAVYDEKGRMKSAKFYDDNGQLRCSNSYTYFGSVLSQSEAFLYDYKGKLYRLSTYEYDENGEVSQQTNIDYDERGVPDHKTVFQHSTKGRTSVKESKPNSAIIKHEFFASPQIAPSKPKVPIEKEKKTIEPKHRISYEDIDSHGNWTKMIIFGGTEIINDQKVETREITYRAITYY